ncbi:hypothetical protein VPH35_015589 [Triticum aestivum]
MERSYHTDPSRRPRSSNKMVVSSPAIEHAEYILRQHAVTLMAADRAHSTSPMVVGKAFDAQLRTPPHQLRVMAHHPEAFLVHFDLPAHRDNAVRRGVLKVEGCKYFIRAWNPDDHAAILKLTLHVCIIVKDLPMQLWSLEGAEEAFGDFGRIDRLDSRTNERGHTKTFACWLWAWDVAHIPTKRALWVVKRGAGRVDQILGFSPPEFNVPPPPNVHRYDLLIHVDRVEDWTPLSPRSSHSGQSGLPSSGEEDDRPLPRTDPGTWVEGVEDGQSKNRRGVTRVSSGGCSSFPILGDRRDHGDEGHGSHGGRSWRDTLLGRGRTGKSKMPISEAPRHRSRTPASRQRRSSRGRSVERASPPATSLLRATPPLPLQPRAPPPPPEEDPVAQFFSFSDSGRTLEPPPRTDCMQLEFENAMLEALSSPLDFNSDDATSPQMSPPTMLPTALLPNVMPCVTQPTTATIELQAMVAVTERINHMKIQEDSEALQLFSNIQPPVLTTPKQKRTSAPPKSRAVSVPSRRSARQAMASSTVPVSQRAALRLVKELGELGPGDKMTPEMAARLIKRFNEPLTDADIQTIAKLTNLDVNALKIAAAAHGPDGAAKAAE